jgi:hypothetical protein
MAQPISLYHHTIDDTNNDKKNRFCQILDNVSAVVESGSEKLAATILRSCLAQIWYIVICRAKEAGHNKM